MINESQMQQIPTQLCPACGHHLDSVMGLYDDSPMEKDDITICIGCGSFLSLTDDYKYMILPQERVDDLDPDVRDELEAVQAIIKKLVGMGVM